MAVTGWNISIASARLCSKTRRTFSSAACYCFTDGYISLELLFTSLSNHQRRQMQTMIRQQDLRLDILGKVPLEIAIEISQYLNIRDVIVARQTCREWLTILSSSLVMDAAFNCWNPRLELALPQSGMTSRAISNVKAEHIHALTTGDPFAFFVQYRKSSANRSAYSRVAYSEGMLAWFGDSDSVIHVHNLLSRDKFDLSPSRGKIQQIAVSPVMLAVLRRSGKCRVYDASKVLLCEIQLQPYPVYSITILGDVFVILRVCPGQPQFAITTICAGESVPKTFSAKRNVVYSSQMAEPKVMIEKSRKNLLIFELSHRPEVLYYQEISMRGDVQSRGELQLPDNLSTMHLLNHPEVSDNARWITLWAFRNSAASQIACLQYASVSSSLRTMTYNVRAFRPAGSNVFLHSDIIFYYKKALGARHLTISKLGSRETQTAVVDGYLQRQIDEFPVFNPTILRSRSRSISASTFLGDERFSINVGECGFFVWSFDRHSDIKSGEYDTHGNFMENDFEEYRREPSSYRETRG